MTQNFADDIPLDIARAAHAGTSWAPEERAEQERAGYASTLATDFTALERLATTDEKRQTLAAEFERYRDRYRALTIDHLRAKSRCVSMMIAGPSNFPTRRHEKIGRVEQARVERLLEYRPRALAAIRKALTPELQPIMTGDSDAIERLEAKLEAAEKLQARMATANAALRKHKKAGPEAQVAALVALGLQPGTATRLLEPDFMGRVGYADFELKNNGAEIRRIRTRLAQVTTAKTADPVYTDGAAARLEDVPAENRVRLFFPGKPSAEVRARLKAAGFRWTPTLGCWQAYRNHRSLGIAATEAQLAPAAQAVGGTDA